MHGPHLDTVRGMNSPEPALERIARLAAGPEASEWFRGSLVAYQETVKFDVLGVRRGPLVDPDCAEGMARGVGRLLGADVAVAATGVGGPDPSEGKPAGTVYVA